MAETKEPTHWIVAVPNVDGTYKNPDGQRVNIHKFPIERTVYTKWPKFKGTTITNFLANSNYKR